MRVLRLSAAVLLSVLGLALAGVLPVAAARTEPLTMFAAASLADALTAAGQAYEAQGGEPVRFSFAASSTLARQIEAGAPAQLYAAANETWMDYLADRGLILAASRVSPIGNDLVLVAPGDSPLRSVALSADTDLAAMLGPDGRLALGDPDHVPAGIYARTALESLGLWTGLSPHLARTDNVRGALALVDRGEAPLGIVYATDAAIAPGVKVLGRFPRDSHPPISYPFALLAGTEDLRAARAFLAFLTGPQGLAIFERFGFQPNR